MAVPYFVRLRKYASKRVRIGTTTSTMMCALRTKTSPTSQIVSSGVGYASYSSSFGSQNWNSKRSWVTPSVATKSTTRGDLESRRTTTSSITAPSAAPITRAAGSAT